MRIGKFLYYQYNKKFLFWSNILDFKIGNIHLDMCWSRTFVWSTRKHKRFVFRLYWFNGHKLKEIIGNI